MDKKEIKARKKAYKKARRRARRPWKFLTLLSGPLAVLFMLSPCLTTPLHYLWEEHSGN